MQLTSCATYHFLSLACKMDMWIYSRQVKVFEWARKYEKQDLIIQHTADCSCCFRTIKGTVLKSNELSTTVSQLHALALEMYHAETFSTQIECM